MNNALVQIINLNMNKDKKELFKEIIINFIFCHSTSCIYHFKKYGIKVTSPGAVKESDMMNLGKYVRDVIALNKKNFRIFGPDEAMSNRLNHVFEETNRQFNGITTNAYL